MADKCFSLNIFTSIIIIIAIIFPTCSCQIITPTTTGFVRGKSMTANGINVIGYLGIPFAQPPVNELRFKPPEPVISWGGVLNATEYQYSCPQRTPIFQTDPNSLSSQISEDCLYLNIFTTNPSNAANMSVMVYIHGGGFTTGTAARTYGEIFAANEGVVVVAINYRIGVLGFMTSGEQDISQRTIQANLGLQDQNLALKWIRDNIENFGGNPDLVTLVGNSAGGLSIACHLIMPESKGLFRGVIMQSSPYGDIPSYLKSALTSPLTLAVARLNFQRFNLAANCSGSTSSQILKCLQALPLEHVLKFQLSLQPRLPALLIFPVADGSTILEPLYTAIPAGRFHKVPVMSGTTLNDGYFMLTVLNDVANGISRQRFLSLVSNGLFRTNQRIRLALEYQYTNWSNVNSPVSNRDQFGDLANDFAFAMPNQYFIDQFSSFVPTYTYIFAHRTRTTWQPAYLKVVHAIEIPYVLGVPVDKPSFYQGSFTAQEVELSRQVMSYWGNFIRNGDPTGLNSPLAWPRYTENAKKYFWIAPTFAVVNNFFASQIAFWNKYLPQIAVTAKTQTTPIPTNATVTQNSHSLESNYMIATFALSGVAGLLLIILLVLVWKVNKVKCIYVK